MSEYHVVVNYQGGTSFYTQYLGNHPRLHDSVHHVVRPVNDKLAVVIWWPQQFGAEIEESQNDLCVQSLRERFQE